MLKNGGPCFRGGSSRIEPGREFQTTRNQKSDPCGSLIFLCSRLNADRAPIFLFHGSPLGASNGHANHRGGGPRMPKNCCYGSDCVA